MAEPVLTRVALRRRLCRALDMPFFRRFESFSTLQGTPSATKVRDGRLTQEEDYWASTHIFLPVSTQVARVEGFLSASNELIPEMDLSPVPGAGEAYELHSIYTAYDLHDALNDAIDDAWPAFFDVVLDESLVLQEDKLTFDLSGLTSLPWYVTKLWAERNTTTRRGIVTSAAAGYIIDTSLIGALGSVTSSWKVSIYHGTGKGQLRSVSSVVDATGKVSPSVNWTTIPDTTSKYALWDPTDEEVPWRRIVDAGFDAKEWPNNLYLHSSFSEEWGLRLRAQLVTRPARLTTDTAATPVPAGFVIPKARSLLYGQKASDNRFDQNQYKKDEDYYRQIAELYRRERAFELPDGTLWQAPTDLGLTTDQADPLAWRGT